MAREARLLDLGLVPYRQAWDMQRALHARVSEGREPETWIFVEHPPVITLGRKASEANLLRSRALLAAGGVHVEQIERGGDVTYHGPGQLVVYPIRKLERFREVVPLVRALEAAVIDACTEFGVRGERWSEHAGVWVGNHQICAVGLAVQKMTTLHGIALNVCTDLSYNALINPCGLADRGITSLAREAGRDLTLAQIKPAMRAAIERAFGLELQIPEPAAKAS